MRAQLVIRITGTEPIIIDVVDDESVHIGVDTHANAFMPQPTSPDLKVTGLRWRDGKHYHLAWRTESLRVGDSLHVTYSEGDAAPTSLESDKEYVAPEKSCRFCDKAASQVEFLVERSFLASICSDCVKTCANEIEARRKTAGR